MSVINTNVSAMQAQNSLRTTSLNQSTSMERLATGTRINSAKDDAAGLAISTRMTASIRGISAAIRNANDGISLTQTAEGSLSQIGDNLQRIRELAVQSSNTGNSASDRAAMNSEAKQLVAEIDRVASNTSFNSIKLLDGSFQNQDLQVGASNDANDRIGVSIGSAKSSALGVGSNSSYTATLSGSAVGATALQAGELAINGYSVGAAVADGVSASNSSTSGIAVAAAINAISGQSGVTATVGSTVATAITGGTPETFAADAITAEDAVKEKQTVVLTDTATADGTVEFLGASVDVTEGNTATQVAAAIAAAFTDDSTQFDSNIDSISAATGTLTITYKDTAGNVAEADTSTNNGITFGKATQTTEGALAIEAKAETFDAPATEGSPTVVTGFIKTIDDGDIKINGVNIGAIAAAGDAAERGGQMAAAINSKSSQTGVVAAFNTTSGAVTLTAADGRNIDVSVKNSSALTAVDTGLKQAEVDDTAEDGTYAVETVRSSVSLSSTQEKGITVTDRTGVADTASGLSMGNVAATATAGAGVSSIDLTTAAGSQAALTTLDAAINTVTDSRAAMGAYQNRLTASISNLESTSLNLSASRSRILDTDYAKETTNLAKAQIISQAATAMLAQANQSGQSVLALLQ